MQIVQFGAQAPQEVSAALFGPYPASHVSHISPTAQPSEQFDEHTFEQSFVDVFNL